MLETIRPTDLHADIRDRLQAYIRDRGMRPGDRLPSEQELVASLGVSRPALREALRTLEAIGIIEARHGSGRFLNHFSLDTVGVGLSHLLIIDSSRAGELLEIRRELEVAFLPAAAALLEAEDLDELRAVVEVMRQKRSRDEPATEEELAFHSTLFRRSGNGLLNEVLRVFWRLLETIEASGMLPQSTARDIPEMHGQIVELIAQDRVEAAAVVLRAHFDDLAQRLARVTRGSAPVLRASVE